MDLGIAGRRALVCGASKGLGLGCARALAAEGVHVLMVARGADALEAAATELRTRVAHEVEVEVETMAADITTEGGRASVLARRSDFDIVVTNAGGLDPKACASAVVEVLRSAEVTGLKIGLVTGDDVSPLLKERDDPSFSNWETKQPISEIRDQLVTANAYVGAEAAAQALSEGAEIASH